MDQLKTTIYKSQDGKKHSKIFKVKHSKKSPHNTVWQKKIIPRNKVKLLARKLRRNKEVVVFTPGSYDMIHVGHARYLALGKSLGTVLVVGLNSDKSIKAYKGEDRPILNQDRRAEMLAHLTAVDYVVIFDDAIPDINTNQLSKEKRAEELANLAMDPNFKGDFFSSGVIKDLKPDKLLCIEESWEGRLHQRPEVRAVLSYGGEVYCSPRQDPELSTSKIITKLMEDGKRDFVKEISTMLNEGSRLKGSL